MQAELSALRNIALVEPHRLAYYLSELAGLFHPYYKNHRVIQDDRDLMFARLALCESVGLVLRNGLGLLGLSSGTKFVVTGLVLLLAVAVEDDELVLKKNGAPTLRGLGLQGSAQPRGAKYHLCRFPATQSASSTGVSSGGGMRRVTS